MGKIIRNGIEFSGACEDATAINYNNSLSGLEAQTVQEAVDEVSNSLGGIEFAIIDGKPQWKERGADSFSPFSSGVGGILEYKSTLLPGETYTTTENCYVFILGSSTGKDYSINTSTVPTVSAGELNLLASKTDDSTVVGGHYRTMKVYHLDIGTNESVTITVPSGTTPMAFILTPSVEGASTSGGGFIGEFVAEINNSAGGTVTLNKGEYIVSTVGFHADNEQIAHTRGIPSVSSGNVEEIHYFAYVIWDKLYALCTFRVTIAEDNSTLTMTNGYANIVR